MPPGPARCDRGRGVLECWSGGVVCNPAGWVGESLATLYAAFARVYPRESPTNNNPDA